MQRSGKGVWEIEMLVVHPLLYQEAHCPSSAGPSCPLTVLLQSPQSFTSWHLLPHFDTGCELHFSCQLLFESSVFKSSVWFRLGYLFVEVMISLQSILFRSCFLTDNFQLVPFSGTENKYCCSNLGEIQPTPRVSFRVVTLQLGRHY